MDCEFRLRFATFLRQLADITGAWNLSQAASRLEVRIPSTHLNSRVPPRKSREASAGRSRRIPVRSISQRRSDLLSVLFIAACSMHQQISFAMYSPVYSTNQLTGRKRKRHRNQLWWKHRWLRSMTPGQQVLSTGAFQQAQAWLQILVGSFLLQQAIYQSFCMAFQLQISYYETIFPNVAATLRWCRLPEQTNNESTELIRHAIILFHASFNLEVHLQQILTAHGLAVNIFLDSMQHVCQLFQAESSLMDLPIVPPPGRYSLPLQNIRLQNYLNLAHANVHVESRYRFQIEEIRLLLNKLRLPIYWRLQRPNQARCYEFNSEELLLYFLYRFANGYSHVEASRVFGGDESRWGFGYRCMLRRWLLLYGHRLDINPGFEFFLDDLEIFRSKIRTQANKERVYPREESRDYFD